MYKEIIICLIIVITIIIGNVITQNYTKDKIEAISVDLIQLRQELSNKDIDWEKSRQYFENINKNWYNMKNNMSYFIEHDELEKVENNFTGLKSFIETQENAEAINELDKGVFTLKHIEDKNSLNLRNIF